MQRHVFFLSDRTGITAESLGHSLLTQFDGIEFINTTKPYLDSVEKVDELVECINQAAAEDGQAPILFSTMINPELRARVALSDGILVDFFAAFTPILEAELGVLAARVAGRSHGMGDYNNYSARIEALNYSLNNDDGATVAEYDSADLILVGVSRVGKTPTSLFLALHYGIHAANYPLAEDDLEGNSLPACLVPHRSKLVGLTIDPNRLHQIRSERRPRSRYANLEQCLTEVQAAEAMYRKERMKHLNITTMSIEEIATTVMQEAGIKRRLYT